MTISIGLSENELRVLGMMRANLVIRERKTKAPVIIGMVGLTGSGKSPVAIELAKHLGAVVISGDGVRVELRKVGEKFDNAWQICEMLAADVLKKGGNAVLDADHILPERRSALKKTAKHAGAQLYFVRTYCDRDILFGRTICFYDRLKNMLGNDFFAGAKSGFPGPAWISAAAVKIRESWRRTPHHYRWSPKGGGTWTLKRLPFASLEVDINPDGDWKNKIAKFTEKI